MPTMTQRLSLSVLVPILILIGSAITGMVARTRPSATNAAVRMSVLDVGQGDALLLDGPGDAEILIDGGSTPDLARTLRRLLGDDRTIDLIVLTHPHADHLVGLIPVLERYNVGRVLMTGAIHTTEEYERFLALVRDRKVPTTIAIAGQTYDVGPVHLEVLYPFENLLGKRVDNLNSSSIVALATIEMQNAECPDVSEWKKAGIPNLLRDRMQNDVCPRARLLLTGDAEADVEAAMLERYCADRPDPIGPCPTLQADVLKVPHHGSQDSSSAPFLTAVAPQHAIISVGKRNDYGHPHRRALKRLERTSARIWRTDQHGDVTVTFGEDGLSVSSER
ncbi:MBL fold metallo-hydrolase [Candidatus Uhrbacteria bacterium]|nr:MBL fold metallo-hydrolase [Candidatus Uhrbacteria bacterium]